jgi:hypothetical protein
MEITFIKQQHFRNLARYLKADEVDEHLIEGLGRKKQKFIKLKLSANEYG